MSISTIPPMTCGTDGCTNTGHGISIAVSRPSIYRCHDCITCLNALAPRWIRGFTDERAYADRNTELGHLNATSLREQAAPVLAAIDKARDAFTMLADLVGPALARDTVTAIVNAGDHVIDCSITNCWAAYRYPEHHPRTAPTRAAYRFDHVWQVRVDGRAVGSVRRVTAGVLDRYEPRTLTGSVLRPDLPDDEQPRHDSVHAATDALIAWTADREPAPDAVAPGHS
ncbi:hypothetical protein ACIOD2_47285 [Amycolatopsis sp. NPDC088138]|uniref:hypothetical protein n=1 Tax=Amycolatopsis sp. NPDC088138 TaxID=3363938 RepID=UPI00382992E7